MRCGAVWEGSLLQSMVISVSISVKIQLNFGAIGDHSGEYNVLLLVFMHTVFIYWYWCTWPWKAHEPRNSGGTAHVWLSIWTPFSAGPWNNHHSNYRLRLASVWMGPRMRNIIDRFQMGSSCLRCNVSLRWGLSLVDIVLALGGICQPRHLWVTSDWDGWWLAFWLQANMKCRGFSWFYRLNLDSGGFLCFAALRKWHLISPMDEMRSGGRFDPIHKAPYF